MQPISIEIKRIQLRTINLLEEGKNNARYMTPAQFELLVNNIKRDGVLTSVPLLYTENDGSLTCLSGNHRVGAAKAALIEEADCMVINSKLTKEQRTAIQLSHNAITGQDDLNVLLGLYQSLDCTQKEYSGITDDTFKMITDLDLAGLAAGQPKYEEIACVFLPEEKIAFASAIEKIKKAPKSLVLGCKYEDFDSIFATLVKTKEKMNIHNTAIAMRVMAELALAQLDHLAEVERNSTEGAKP